MAIDRAEFARIWEHLSVRFGREADKAQGAAYYEFLTLQMETETFVAAARVLWATSRFFPRPADFLLVNAASEWTLVLAAAEGYAPPWSWTDPWNLLSPRSQDACRALGGMTTVRQLWERDVTKLKFEWEKAYEQMAAAEIMALPMPTNPRRLRPA